MYSKQVVVESHSSSQIIKMSRLRNSTHLRPEDAADPVHVAEAAAAGAEDVRGSVLHHQA